MLDIKNEFTLFCGPSVLYRSHDQQPRTLKIVYTIPAVSEDKREVFGHMRNGLASVLRQTVRAMAASARNDAYRQTGHRDADMAHLLSGRVI